MTDRPQINPPDTSSTEERLRLFNLARRLEDLTLQFPDLAPSRIMNRLHAQGVPCDSRTVEAARALAAATPAASQGLSAGTAADFLGLKRAQFTHWLQGGFPEGTTIPHAVLAEKPPRLYYDTLDLHDLKRWIDEHPEALQFDPLQNTPVTDKEDKS